MVDKNTAEHYIWGENCDGWRFLQTENLSVVLETVLPGVVEERHYHKEIRQFFYIISGTATIELDGQIETLISGQGIEIPAGLPHKLINETDKDLELLVVSSGLTAVDRYLA